MNTFLIILLLNTMQVIAIPTSGLEECVEQEVSTKPSNSEVFCIEADSDYVKNGGLEDDLETFREINEAK